MVVTKEENTNRARGVQESSEKAAIIKGSTPYDTCEERLTAFGGFLAFVKFVEVIGMKEVFDQHWIYPVRKPVLGCWRMLMGCLSLLFIGFQRLGQFAYIRTDSMLCGYFGVTKLPVISTYWRYLRSLGINQARSLLKISAVLRNRVWQMTGLCYRTIHVNIDTTVATVYGNIEGACKGHNTKHRGKKGLRPVLLFIQETREYLCGDQRRGETMNGAEVASLIRDSKQYLPIPVRHVVICGDGEFISWESIAACQKNGYDFIFGNKRCAPSYPPKGWYRHGTYEYNEVMYQPIGWEMPCRFVVMRILKEQMGERQLNIFEGDNYAYRDFATNRAGKPHKVIKKYDGRADVENCIGEAQRAGLLAIPSRSFASNRVFFQMVMMAYNLWRWMNIAATRQEIPSATESQPKTRQGHIQPTTTCVIPVLRLKMLFVAAKIVTHSDLTKVRYSAHDARAENIMDFMAYLDKKRKESMEWWNEDAVTRYRLAG
jgi:hypothetical protein